VASAEARTNELNDMNENEMQFQDFNRRGFLKSGSLATLMTMLGGVEILAQTNNVPGTEAKYVGPKVKIAVIGLGTWGREIVNTLAVIDQAELVAICDTYPASVRRAAKEAPNAAQTDNYQTILDNKDIKAIVIATPTYKHKELVEAALKAGKHVYCEAPLASTIEDARAIASAAQAAKTVVFQTGLQFRSDPFRRFLLPFIRSGALGQSIMARAQWHKKQSWRATSPKPEREKELNWRLSRATSCGLIGELGCHPIDQATWFLNAKPVAVGGLGSVMFWKDDRDVPDTVQALLEFPGGVFMDYNATLANSFDADYEMLYGSDAAVLLRDGKAWMFKEVDSPLLGWEVYASKETFYKETGILLQAGKSKAPPANEQQAQAAQLTSTPLGAALTNFLRNVADYIKQTEDFTTNFGSDDQNALAEELAKVQRRPAASALEGYQNAVLVIKTNEAILTGKRIEIKPEMYELS
jgi:predicted dehydrogenase